jgi:GNAT superfamily N-acetyltransferase
MGDACRMFAQAEIVIVTPDHPSLEDAVQRFLTELRRETRFFGPSSTANPKPFPSLVNGLALVDGLGSGGKGFRLAAFRSGRILGMTRISESGMVLVAVTPDARGCGVGTALMRAGIERSRRFGYSRLSLRSSRRSRAAQALATSMGFLAVDYGRGRVDLILDLHPASHSA